VIDGRLAHSVLLEVFTTSGVGTMVSSGGVSPDDRKETHDVS
jgi:acetylglutamate kinase